MPTRSVAFLCRFLLAALLLAPLGAGAAHGPHTWNQRMKKSEALLQSGDYAAAYEITALLHDEIGRSLVDGPATALGGVLALHALAAAGTGRADDAVWYWHLAESLKPSLETTDLSGYGAAGEFFTARCLPSGIEADGCEVPGRDDGEEAGTSGAVRRTDDPEVTPPKKLSAPGPQYSPEARKAGVEGTVVIQAVIARDGTVRKAAILKSDYPCLGYLVSQALRQWRFEPARLDGKPVEVHYNLAVNLTTQK